MDLQEKLRLKLDLVEQCKKNIEQHMANGNIQGIDINLNAIKKYIGEIKQLDSSHSKEYDDEMMLIELKVDNFKKDGAPVKSQVKPTGTKARGTDKPKMNDIPKQKEKSQFNRDLFNEVMAEIDSLIGMEDFKKYVKELVASIEIDRQRQENNLSITSNSYHMVIMGNPGTGKTTIARKMAKLYYSLGVLDTDQCIELGREQIVGQHIGHTEDKIVSIMNDAMDGVLFIDEAYSLTETDSKNDFGKVAVNALIRYMEDYRDRLIIIVAGYTNEMEGFLKSNPGLNSRFTKKITLPDYTDKELFDIFKFEINNKDFVLVPGLDEKIIEYFGEVKKESKDNNFGNARFVRNFVELMVRKQHTRLYNTYKSEVPVNQLKMLTLEDLENSKNSQI